MKTQSNTETNSDHKLINLLRPGIGPATIALVAVNVVVFIVSEYILGHDPSVRKMFALWPTAPHRVFVELWRPFTFQFLHLSPTHICLNMFVVIQGGPKLQKQLGSLKFLLFYRLPAGLSAFLYERLILAFHGPAIRACGASGGVYAIMAAMLALNPKINIGIRPISIPFWLALIAATLISNHGLRTLGDAGEIIHLTALAVGYTFAKLLLARSRKHSD